MGFKPVIDAAFRKRRFTTGSLSAECALQVVALPFRRLPKDYEGLKANCEVFIHIAMIHLLLRDLLDGEDF